MGFRFIGGPYDGMDIDPALLDRYATLSSTNGDLRARLFVQMPPREDWDRLIRGEEVRPVPAVTYEQVLGPEGVSFRAAAPDAIERARSESRLKITSLARTMLAGLSEPERRRVIEAADALQQDPPERWSQEKVLRISEEEPVYLLRVPPDLRVFVRITEDQRLELFDVVREATLQLFRERPPAAGAPR
jgi:hypothetical protein